MTKPDLAQAQLFIDDTWIADSLHVQRVLHQPRKTPDPVIKPDLPHEGRGIVAYGTVLFREDKFHAWYVTWTRNTPLKVCYAVSADGVNFTKPDLGIYEFNGSKRNNICLMLEPPALIDNISVIEDPDDAQWPLKAIFYQGVGQVTPGTKQSRGLVACRSKDGLHWDLTPGLVLPGYGDRTNAVAGKINGKFVVLTRAPDNPYATQRLERLVWRTESADLVEWSQPELIHKPDLADDPLLQIYSATAFRYESVYLGFIERMHLQPDKLDSELCYSHDSRAWQRAFRRETFIPWGMPGAFDSDWLNMTSGSPIVYKNNLWFYYSGRSAAHNAPYPLTCGAIGLAILRPDGFASLRGGPVEGWALTPPMEWPKKGLLVNAEPRPNLTSHTNFSPGSIKVEVRDADNKPLPGFGREDCLPIRNTCRHQMARAPVLWKDNRNLLEMAGRKIRLAFYLREAHLYSFCAGGQPS